MKLSSSSAGLLVSVSLEGCPLCGSLRQTKACFCLTKYLALIFTVLWLNKVPFNSLIYGYAYSKQIIIFHNNLWWSESTGRECINPCVCSRERMHERLQLTSTSSLLPVRRPPACKKEPCASSSRSSRYHLQWRVTTTHVWVEAIPIF